MSDAPPRPLLTAATIALPLCLCDPGGRILEANTAFATLAGLGAGALIGSGVAALGVVDAPSLDAACKALRAGAAPSGQPMPGTGPASGRVVLFTAAQDDAGRPAGLAILVAPCPTAEFAAQEQRANFALECAGQWVWEWDLVEDKVWRSPNWERTLGYVNGETVDDGEPWNIVHPEDRPAAARSVDRIINGEADRFEATYRLRHRDGTWRWFMSRGRIAARAADGRPVRVLATTIDVNRQKETEDRLTRAMAESAEISRQLAELNAQLAELSEHDGLTGLANRRAFEREWAASVDDATEKGEALSLLMVDVDYFKQFNDLMGHLAGDQCLRRIADALAHAAGPRALVCRFGGEEFAVLLSGGQDTAKALADRIMETIEQLEEPHPGSPLGRLTVSIGLASLAPGETGDDLLRRADAALYAAKHDGRNLLRVAASPGEPPAFPGTASLL